MKQGIFSKAVFTIFFLLFLHLNTYATDYTFSGTGLWTDATKWSPSAPPNSVPFGDTIIIAPNAICTVDDQTPNFIMTFGTAFKVKSGAVLTINTIRNFGSQGEFIVETGATLHVNTRLFLMGGGTFDNRGTSHINFLPVSIFKNSGIVHINSVRIDGTSTNSGTMNINGNRLDYQGAATQTDNTGTINLNAGALIQWASFNQMTLPWGNFNWQDGATIMVTASNLNINSPLTLGEKKLILAGGNLTNNSTLTDEGGISSRFEGFMENNGVFIAKAAFTGNINVSNNGGSECQIDYDNATFPAITTNAGSKISINANRNVILTQDLTIGSGSIFEIKTGASLTQNSGKLTLQTGVFFINNGLIDVNSTFSVGSVNNITNTGTINVNNNGVFELTNPNATFPTGIFNWQSGGAVAYNGTGELNINAPMTIPAGHIVRVTKGTMRTNAAVTNDGTIESIGAGSFQVNAAFTNNSLIQAKDGGLFQSNFDCMNKGTMESINGGSINTNAVFTNSGVLAVGSNSFVNIRGVLNQSGSIITEGELKVDFGANVNIVANTTLGGHRLIIEQFAQLIVKSGVTLTVNRFRATFGGQGSLIVESGATLQVNSSILLFGGGTFDNRGTSHINFLSVSVFKNSGIVNMNSIRMEGTSTNSGTLNINGDRLDFQSNATQTDNTGTINLNTGGLIQWASRNTMILPWGNFNWLDGGTIMVTASNLNINSPLVLGGKKLIFAGGILTNNSTLTDEGGISSPVEGFIENNGLFIAKAAFSDNINFSNNNGSEYRIDYANAIFPSINPKTGSKLSINTNASATLPNNFTLNTGVILDIKTGGTLTHSNGIFTIQNTTNFVNNGVFNHNAQLAFTGTINNTATFNLNSGSLNLSTGKSFNNTGTFVNNTQIFRTFGSFTNSGIYKGSGAFVGFFINEASGTIAPGNSVGCHSFGNGITNNGTIQVEIGGSTACSEHDRIAVVETAHLGGTLQVSFVNGFTPTAGQSFTIVIAEQINGTFNNVQFPQGINGRISYLASDVKVIVDAVLPIDFLDFKGKNTEGGNFLIWKTAIETNTSDFDIERSHNGKEFEKIGMVKAKGSNTVYEFWDNAPLSNLSYYRLKINDLDGKADYSKVISVKTKGSKKTILIYPTIVSDGFLNIQTEDNFDTQNAQFFIFSIAGHPVLNGKMAQQIDVSNLTAGTYVFTVRGEQVKFIKQ